MISSGSSKAFLHFRHRCFSSMDISVCGMNWVVITEGLGLGYICFFYSALILTVHNCISAQQNYRFPLISLGSASSKNQKAILTLCLGDAFVYKTR